MRGPRARRYGGASAEFARKGVHLALLLLPAMAYRLMPLYGPLVRKALVGLAIVIIAADVLRLAWSPFHRFISRMVGPILRPAEGDRILGSTVYLAALALSFLLFSPPVALTGMVYLIVGDAAAAIVGRAYGRHRLPSGKSVEGAAACLSTCLVAAVILGQLGVGPARLPLLVGAVAATVAELMSPGRWDNLSVPVLTGVVMMLVEKSL